MPLLTTKQMGGNRWTAIVHELLWHLSGERNVHSLDTVSTIWEPWTDESGNVDSAVGRFWRRFPLPECRPDAEPWVNDDNEFVNRDGEFDQIRHLIRELQTNPQSRRLVVNAWHPANTAASSLPPCDFSFTVNVQQGKLNIHVTQRSADLALGVPFDVAKYGLIAKILAQRTELKLGMLNHTMVDTHIYCGKGPRGQFYKTHREELSKRLAAVDDPGEYLAVKDWVESAAPPEHQSGYDHVPGLLEQLSRNPFDRPEVEIADKDIDTLTCGDFELIGYESHPPISFRISE